MSNLSLYEISEDIVALMDRAVSDELLTQEEIDKQYEELTVLLQNKVAGVISYYHKMDAFEASVDKEINRLNALKKQVVSAKEKYKQRTKYCMENANIYNVETPVGSLKIAKNPISVEIEDIDKIPDEYKTGTLTFKGTIVDVKAILQQVDSDIRKTCDVKPAVDKKAITKHFKATGELIDGVIIHTDNTRLDIK